MTPSSECADWWPRRSPTRSALEPSHPVVAHSCAPHPVSSHRRRWLRMGDTLMVFLHRDPLLLVAVSRTGETQQHLRRMLELLYETIVFFASDKPLQQLRSDPLYRFDRHMAGTESTLQHAIRLANRSFAVTADAVPMLSLAHADRTRIASALRSVKGAAGPVAAAVIVGSELAAFATHPRFPLRPRDLVLLAAFVQSSPSLRSTEAFVPVCLPGVAASALLHAHVSFVGACRRGAGRSGAAFSEPIPEVVLPVCADSVDDSAAAVSGDASGARAHARGAGGAAGGSGGPASRAAAHAPADGSAGVPAQSQPLARRVAGKVTALAASDAAGPPGLAEDLLAAVGANAAAEAYALSVAGSFAPGGSCGGSDSGKLSGKAVGPAGATSSQVQLPASAAAPLIDAAAAHIKACAKSEHEADNLSRLAAFVDEQGEGVVDQVEWSEPSEHSGLPSSQTMAPGPRGAAHAPLETTPPEPMQADFFHRVRRTAANPNDDAFLVVVGTEVTPEAFTALRQSAGRVHEELARGKAADAIATAVELGGPVASDLGFSAIQHFVYLWKPARQLVVGRFPHYLRSHRARKRLLRRYQAVWEPLTSAAPPVRHLIQSSPDGTLGGINTTNAVLVCLSAGGSAAGGRPAEPGSLVRMLEEFAKALRRSHGSLLMDRVPHL